jgi:nucleoside-diphosphate-sugar epimerase
MGSSILIIGAAGFIGGHLVREFLRDGHRVRAVDRKPQSQWSQRFAAAENLTMNLQEEAACIRAVNGCDLIYNMAAGMGGMGFIELNKCLCMLSVLINTHMLMAARQCGALRFFFPSSACVYASCKQQQTDNPALSEEDAYPADPEDGYGWEKLFSERMCRHFREDFGLETRIARYHNVYGPHGTFDGGREKAPAAVCRKVIAAKLSGRHKLKSGEMANRRAALCSLTIAFTAPASSWRARSHSRSTSGVPKWSRSINSSTSWRNWLASSSSATTNSTLRKVSAAAAVTIP